MCFTLYNICRMQQKGKVIERWQTNNALRATHDDFLMPLFRFFSNARCFAPSPHSTLLVRVHSASCWALECLGKVVRIGQGSDYPEKVNKFVCSRHHCSARRFDVPNFERVGSPRTTQNHITSGARPCSRPCTGPLRGPVHWRVMNQQCGPAMRALCTHRNRPGLCLPVAIALM